MSSFLIFIGHPLLALIPALIFGGMAFAAKGRLVWFAAGAWLLYALYELGMQNRILCSGDCDIRIDLILIIPALLATTLGGLAGAAVWVLRRRSSP